MKTVSVILLALFSIACGYGSKYNAKTGNMGGAATVATLAPSTVTAGDPAFTLTITGSGFSAGSVVYWNNVAKPTGNNGTVYVTPTRLTATISAADIANPGAVPVYVLQNTLKSNIVDFMVN